MALISTLYQLAEPFLQPSMQGLTVLVNLIIRHDVHNLYIYDCSYIQSGICEMILIVERFQNSSS